MLVAAAGCQARGHGPEATAVPELALRDRDIAFYEDRVRRDPASALDCAQLAGLYLARARETGDHQDLHRAEAAARRSLAGRWRRNGKAALTLASSLVAQHRFGEALEVADSLCASELTRIDPRQLTRTDPPS